MGNLKKTSAQFIEYFKSGNSLIFTQHFYEQMNKRGVSIEKVYSFLKSDDLKVIQFHPPGTYLVQEKKYNKNFVYVLSSSIYGNKIHLVVAQKGENYAGVSLYWPAKTVFNQNDKLLKRELGLY